MTDPYPIKGWRRRKQEAAGDAEGAALVRLPYQVVRSGVAYGMLVLLVTAIFVQRRHLPYGYLGWATLLGIAFGLAIAGFDRLASWLRAFLTARCSRAICKFVLFFAYVLGYLVLFSLIVTYPVGILIEQGSGSAAMAMEYGLSTSNVILLFAVLGWLDWGRFVAGQGGRLPWARRRSAQASADAKTLDK